MILLGIEPHIGTVISYARKLIIVNKSVKFYGTLEAMAALFLSLIYLSLYFSLFS